MPEDLSQTLYRFPCPACQRTLKAPVSWSGRSGICPKCQASVKFPPTPLSNGAARTVAALSHLIAEEGRFLEEETADRVSMLLAQGTCMEYAMAHELIGDSPLSVRQWRRLLRSAGAREIMRLQIHGQISQRLYGPTFAEEHDDTDPVLALNPEAIQELTLAWQILVRFQDFLLAGQCKACHKNATGLNCIYQAFGPFAEARNMAPKQQRKWENTCRHLLGLASS